MVACGHGAVEILTLQREGKRPMQADDFLRGAALPDRLA
jgi:methionyl-tRNA formyltransferase